MLPKVLFLSDVPDFKGGAERSLFDLMGSSYIKPILIVPSRGPMAAQADARAIEVKTLDYGTVLTVRRPFKALDVLRTFASALNAARQLKAIAKAEGALCVHSNGLKAHGVACLARLIGGSPVVIHYRAIPFTLLEKMFWKCTQLIAGKVILVSRPCWPGKTLPTNAQVIFNAIEISAKKVPAPKTARPFILGFVGRIQFTKGVDTLIGWFDYAHKQGLDIKLFIRGEAAPDELDYDRKVREMVKARKLEKLCIFEGRLEGFDKIYGNIHANVVSSVVPDPLPRSVMEACSLGIPVLGYPAGGIPDMIEDGKSGFLVQTAEQFYLTVQKLMEDKKLYEDISKGAVARAKDKFAMPCLHEAVFEVYKTLR